MLPRLSKSAVLCRGCINQRAFAFYPMVNCCSSSLNVFRVYRALAQHLKEFPEEKTRFPNFNPDEPSKKPLLVHGSSAPLEGEVHSAQYFHGRYARCRDQFRISIMIIHRASPLSMLWYVPLITHTTPRDGIADMTLRHPECDEGADLVAEGLRYFRETKQSAAEVVVGVLRERPARSVTYIALGPLTSLAQVLRFDASTVRENIGRVVCMGGELRFYFRVPVVPHVNYRRPGRSWKHVARCRV